MIDLCIVLLGGMMFIQYSLPYVQANTNNVVLWEFNYYYV